MLKSTEKLSLQKANNSVSSNISGRIAFFIRNLEGGGAQKILLNLLKPMVKQGMQIDLVLSLADGHFLAQVPEGVRVIDLKSKQVIPSTLPLSRYLQQEKPQVLVANMNSCNVAAVMARMLSSVSTRIVLVEHNTFSYHKSSFPLKAKLFLPTLMRWLYPHADSIIAVSNGAARDLESQINLKKNLVKTIYNPIIDRHLLEKAKEPLDHPWFQPNQPPVILTVGRLIAQKDHETLIRAFALLRRQKPARLLILGEGDLQNRLQTLVKELGIESDVSLPGFIVNPYAYMSQASMFVLSSIYEGLPTVIVEAMACGCPVVSTNCPSGPEEILEDEKYGLLVPVGDTVALAHAMEQMLDNPTDKTLLTQKAQNFTTDCAVFQYLSVMGLKEQVSR
ncbi:glycosyl transferase, group 1 family protein [Calothrix sp. NIES-4101]|nr:glycosyl transferase, group 1 family protein [Calothrix sp. NIES-4101]